MTTEPPQWPAALAAAIVGLCYATLVGALAIMLSGAGHGWNSAAEASFVGLVLIPLAAAAWVYRGHNKGRTLACCTLLAAGLTDVILFSNTRAEGWPIERVWSHIPLTLISWCVLWAAWQVLLISALFTSRAPRS